MRIALFLSILAANAVKAQDVGAEFRLFNLTVGRGRAKMAPSSALSVEWRGVDGAQSGQSPLAFAAYGNRVSSSAMVERARLRFQAKADTFYTIMLLDLGEDDSMPTLYWLVVDARGGRNGRELVEYRVPESAAASERPFAFLVFEQSNDSLRFDEPSTPACMMATRGHFDVEAFRSKYDLRGPLFGNFLFAARSGEKTAGGSLVLPCRSDFIAYRFLSADLPFRPTSAAALSWGSGRFIAGFGNSVAAAQLGDSAPTHAQAMQATTLPTTIMLFHALDGRYFLNWLRVDSGARHLAAYQRPAPPSDGAEHVFVLLVFEQPTSGELLSTLRIGKCDRAARERFDVDEFVRQHRLRLLAGNFFLASGDGTRCCDALHCNTLMTRFSAWVRGRRRRQRDAVVASREDGGKNFKKKPI